MFVVFPCENKAPVEHHKVSGVCVCVAGTAASGFTSSKHCLGVYFRLARMGGACCGQLGCDLAKWQICFRDQEKEELLITSDNMQCVIGPQALSDGEIPLLTPAWLQGAATAGASRCSVPAVVGMSCGAVDCFPPTHISNLVLGRCALSFPCFCAHWCLVVR